MIEFDPTGDLVQTAAGSGVALLKPGSAANNINSGPPGSINSSQINGGPFLPLSGGTLTGNLVMGPGANITSNPPLNSTDVANKQYVDLSGQKAFAGWTLSSGAFAVSVPAGSTVNAFATTTAPIGNQVWTGADGVTITINGAGIITINNTNTFDTYYVCYFRGNGLLCSNASASPAVYFRFYDETNAANITVEQSLRLISPTIVPAVGGQPFNNYIDFSAFIKVLASSSLNISVKARNPGVDNCLLSTNVSSDVCQVMVIRQG